MEFLTEFFSSLINRVVIYLILGIPIALVLVLMARLQIKEIQKQIENVVNFPKSWMWLIIGLSVVLYVSCIGYLVTEFDAEVALGLTILCFIFVVVDVIFALYAFNWRIFIQDDGFIYQSSFRRKFHYEFTDIIRVRTASNGYRIFTAKKSIWVNKNCIGADDLLTLLKNKSVKIDKSIL